MDFGDRIDWGKEAERAAKEMPPDEQPGELHLNVLAAVKGVDAPSIVDCGCNIARFAPPFVAAGFKYVGIDQSEVALDIARRRYPGLAFCRTMLWDDWPSLYPKFDVALCNAVLQHNTHDEKRLILPRIAAAVRSGGVFAMQESTVHAETATQLRQDQWIAIVEEHGFKLATMWHRNDLDILDGYLFRRV
jgi:SAM-dependent methyltransferase